VFIAQDLKHTILRSSPAEGREVVDGLAREDGGEGGHLLAEGGEGGDDGVARREELVVEGLGAEEDLGGGRGAALLLRKPAKRFRESKKIQEKKMRQGGDV
jgi:hypothetical protein